MSGMALVVSAKILFSQIKIRILRKSFTMRHCSFMMRNLNSFFQINTSLHMIFYVCDSTIEFHNAASSSPLYGFSFLVCSGSFFCLQRYPFLFAAFDFCLQRPFFFFSVSLVGHRIYGLVFCANICVLT